MLVLADRAYDSGALLSAIAATGAMFLVRGTSTRKPPVPQLLADGSYLPDLDGLEVRIIEADLIVTGTGGSRIGDRYRLITTLLDHRRYPAAELIQLSHERWESRSPTSRCATPCPAGTCCAPVTGPAPSRSCGPC
jgi:hypothetical protein